jgi:hypothetical protein
MVSTRLQALLATTIAFVAVSAGLSFATDNPPAAKFEPTPDIQAALDRISADSLKGHLSFIASDLLEGRDTPSRGLDLAATYIAAQFRRAGLEPIGDDGYFQTANWRVSEPDPAGPELELKVGDDVIRAGRDSVAFSSDAKTDLRGLPVYQLDKLDDATLVDLSSDKIEGRAVCAALPDPGSVPRDKAAETRRDRNRILRRLNELKAAVVLTVDLPPADAPRAVQKRLIDPENPSRFGGLFLGGVRPPVVSVRAPALIKAIESLPAGTTDATLSLRQGGPVERPVKVRNVAGMLRGSDPELKDSFVLVTAHYDHLGIGQPVDGDAIYNGANDDGSGTVSVIEIASALAALKERPKRSIVFLTFFGEEKGLRGSRYYGKHPLVPVEKTVADVNLEHVGRTDSSDGPEVGTASMTGFDFSDVGAIFAAAGEREGVKVTKHSRNSDSFFSRSDNQALADLGVPAHTICVSYIFPDYHGLLDHWEKVDFANMAKVDRMVALGLLMIANTPQAPRWSADNPKASRYLNAWKKLHPDQ